MVFRLEGEDDGVRVVTLKMKVPAMYPVVRCCGEGTRLEQRVTPARSSCLNGCGKKIAT